MRTASASAVLALALLAPRLALAAPQQLVWTATTPHPANRSPYYAPGFGLGGVFFSKDVCDNDPGGHFAKASSAGLGPWSSGPAFLGNETKQGDPTATTLTHVYSVSWGRNRFAAIDAAGNLSKWDLANADPAEAHILESTGTARGPIRGTMAVGPIGGSTYLYSLGGWEYGSSNAVIPDVFFAKLRPDGKAENWKVTESMPQPLMRSTAAFVSGSLYVFGGFPSNDFANHTDAVVCAPVQADGSLGAWKSLAKMPKAGGAIAGLVDDQYVYLVGGLTRHDPPFAGYANVYAAAHGPGCALGPWTDLAALPEAAAETPYAVLAGRVFVMSTKESAPIPVFSAPFAGRVSNSLGETVTPPKDAGSDAAGGSGGSGGAAADSGSVKPDAKDGSLGGWPEAAASWDSGPSAADGATAGSLFAGPEQSQDGCSCEAPGAKARRGFEGVWAWIAAGLALVRRRRGRSHEAIGDRKSARQEP